MPGIVVVVGDPGLAVEVRRLMPTFRVVGQDSDPDFGDPVTSLEPIRSLLESGSGPDAVVCAAQPGFNLIGQLPHLSPTRCFVSPSGSIWPPETVRWMAESTGMTVLPSPEALPALLLGRSAPGGARETGLTVDPNPLPATVAAIEGLEGASARERPTPDFEWANETPIQVPPPPVSLDPGSTRQRPQVVDAGGPPQTAYLPTDLLRPLRPRTG